MINPKITYYLDKLGRGDESDDIEIDRQALHGQQVSPEIANILLLKSIDKNLRDISSILHEIHYRE